MSEVKYLLSLQKWGLLSDGHLLNALPLQFNNFPCCNNWWIGHLKRLCIENWLNTSRLIGPLWRVILHSAFMMEHACQN